MSTMKAFSIFLLSAVLLASSPARSDSTDAPAIASVMKAIWDKPESPLVVEPVVTDGDIGLAGWSQGDMGGRAMLRRTHGKWNIVLCSGDSLRSAATLTSVGIPTDQATRLADALVKAEKGADPARLAKFSRFDGMVMMDGSGHHPPAAHNHGAQK